jgi:hypothetical protein
VATWPAAYAVRTRQREHLNKALHMIGRSGAGVLIWTSKIIMMMIYLLLIIPLLRHIESMEVKFHVFLISISNGNGERHA